MLTGELGRLGADVVGEQQLSAGRRPQVVDGIEGALVGDREATDLLDRVTPELHPERMLLGGREDVDDATADRELTATLDQVDPHVGSRGEVLDQSLEAVLVASRDGDRSEVGQTLDLRLEQRSHRRDDDLHGHRVGVHEPPQDGQTATDGVGARRQPLVRQGLPRGVVRHRVGADEVAECGDEVLALTRRGGDDEHGAGSRQCGRHEGTERLGPPDGELVDAAVDDASDAGVGPDEIGERAQRGA